MSPKKLHRRWEKRLADGLARVEKLLAECRRAGDVEAVHDLRVALRRTRLMALVGKPLLDRGAVKHFRSRARDISNALGGVRDCDVAIEWLAKHKQSAEIIELLHHNRAGLWRLTRPHVAGLRRADLKQLASGGGGDAGAKKLAERFERKLCAAVDVFEKGAPRFRKLQPLEMHDLRRSVRRWRYLRELVLSRSKQKCDRGLKLLIDFQEALGEVQDLEVVIGLLSGLRGSAEARALARTARAEQERWTKRELRQLTKLLKSKFVATQLAEF